MAKKKRKECADMVDVAVEPSAAKHEQGKTAKDDSEPLQKKRKTNNLNSKFDTLFGDGKVDAAQSTELAVAGKAKKKKKGITSSEAGTTDDTQAPSHVQKSSKVEAPEREKTRKERKKEKERINKLEFKEFRRSQKLADEASEKVAGGSATTLDEPVKTKRDLPPRLSSAWLRKSEKEKRDVTVSKVSSETQSTKTRKEDSATVFIGGLPYEAEQDKLWKDFEECGEITAVRMVKNTDGAFKGIAFIVFKDAAGAKSALEWTGKEYGGRILRVSMAGEFGDKSGKGNGKDKGKGEGKDKGKGEKGKSKGVCYKFQEGKCPHGASCIFAHE